MDLIVRIIAEGKKVSPESVVINNKSIDRIMNDVVTRENNSVRPDTKVS